MKNIYEQWDLWQDFMDMLEKQFGNSCEIVLHDLTKDYNHTIVDIRNGHITGRRIGGCGSNLGLEVLSGNVKNGNRFNYIIHTRDGKILRSSSMYIKDEEGQTIGSLCINLDITKSVKFEEFLKDYNQYEITNQGQQEEIFTDNVEQLLEYLIAEGEKMAGKAAASMNREEKLKFIDFLDQKGAFLISKSGQKICGLLQISKFTLYNYLDIIRGDRKTGEEKNPDKV